jgi:hypothetical protein
MMGVPAAVGEWARFRWLTRETAGGLVFGTREARRFASDAVMGKELWHVRLGATHATPISFIVDGDQLIAVFVGRECF